MIYKDKAVKHKAFTLTEVLLAVAVVGILAALVIPPVVTKFNSEVLTRGFERQSAAITSAVNSLVIKENVKNFSETSMYSNGTQTADDTAGKFMKRYLRVSKYYGDAVVNKALIKKECFANKYYEYSGNSKKEYNVEADLVGACAKLKNGAALCLTPQVGATTNIQGVMDINGPKGPNIMGRDLRRISMGTVPFVNRSSEVTSDAVSTEVYTQDDPDISGAGYDGLCEGDYSAACCDYHHNEAGTVTDPTHPCCSNAAVASTYPECSNEVVLHLNFYPTASCTYAEWAAGSCSEGGPYISESGTYAYKKGESAHLASLPANPPSLNFYCDGLYAGYLSPAKIKAAVINPTSDTYVTRNVSSNSSLQSRRCDYESSSSGIVSGQGSFAFPNGLDNYTFNGVTWWVEKY